VNAPSEHWTSALQRHRQTSPLTALEYEQLDEDFCRTIEIVDGMIVFCDSPSREHQRLMVRLAHSLEIHAKRASTAESCFDLSADVDLRLWDVPLLNRRPDLVLHHCLPDDEVLHASNALLVIEIVSPGSEKRDSVDKLAEYANAGIPHYWIVRTDHVGITSLEWYSLDRGTMGYAHMRTFMRDAGDHLNFEVPVKISLAWEDLLP
jgi:Uma2 family endonuclease